MSLCKACIQGVRHEGTPAGKIEIIGGVLSYVATPSVDYPKDKVLLFLPDVFGLELVNNKLLADGFAANGFKTIIPDYFNGDAIPESVMSPGSTFDRAAWFAKHGQADTRAPLDAVIAALKAEGVTTFGTTGYCFGARYAVDLAIENVTKAIVITHPSMMKVPEDFETLKEKSSNPLMVICNEDDPQYPPEKAEIVDGILGGGQYAPGYLKDYYAGCNHGFAVRGDMSNPVIKAGKEGAFKSAVEFLIKHL